MAERACRPLDGIGQDGVFVFGPRADGNGYTRVLPRHYPPVDPAEKNKTVYNVQRVTKDTVAELICGKYDKYIGKFLIVDMRFLYEFDNGHLVSAININKPEALCALYRCLRQHYAYVTDPALMPLKCDQEKQQQQQSANAAAAGAATSVTVTGPAAAGSVHSSPSNPNRVNAGVFATPCPPHSNNSNNNSGSSDHNSSSSLQLPQGSAFSMGGVSLAVRDPATPANPRRATASNAASAAAPAPGAPGMFSALGGATSNAFASGVQNSPPPTGYLPPG